MESLHQLLDRKGRDIYAVGPDDQVYDAIHKMAEKEVGALLVMQDDKLAGVISERDYARKVILEGKASKTTPVAEIMSSEVITVSLSDSVDECLRRMTKHRIRHLPVVDGEKVVGVLSIGDLVKAKMVDQQHQIESLEQYISG